MPQQVIDTGLDETSCFFIDDDLEEVPHGHYFDELAVSLDPVESPSSSPILPPSATSSPTEGVPLIPSSTSSPVTASHEVFEGGDFSIYPDRRKVNAHHAVYRYGRATFWSPYPLVRHTCSC